MSLAVANRYARALVDVVAAPGSGVEPRQTIIQLHSFEDLLGSSAELRNVLQSPAVPMGRKRAVVTRLCGVLGIAPLVRNFLCVVVDHRRLSLLAAMREALETLLDQRLGLVRARVASAAQLGGEQQAALVGLLTRLTGKQVRCEFRVNPELVGGAAVTIGSTVYDGSVRGQLTALRRRLTSE